MCLTCASSTSAWVSVHRAAAPLQAQEVPSTTWLMLMGCTPENSSPPCPPVSGPSDLVWVMQGIWENHKYASSICTLNQEQSFSWGCIQFFGTSRMGKDTRMACSLTHAFPARELCQKLSRKLQNESMICCGNYVCLHIFFNKHSAF